MRWLIILLLAGCADVVSSRDPDADAGIEDATSDAEPCIDGWLCWSPDTELHNQPCTDECMEVGNTMKFCFLNSCE